MPELVSPVIAQGTLSRDPQPVLVVSDELVLRPWTRADAPMVIDAFRDPATRHWHARSVESVAEAEELIAGYTEGWRTETNATWAVATAAGEALGRMALKMTAGGMEHGEAEIAYWMRAAARGRGAATSALRVLTTWAFGIGFHRLHLQHSVENAVSCRVAEKTGYALEGTLRSAVLHPDGWHDMHLHARINPG